MGTGEGEDGEAVKVHNIIISAPAEAEILETFWYYEGQIPGFGDEFQSALDACLDFIDRYPSASAIARGPVRRALLRRFPYAVYYLVEDNQLTGIACFHVSRDPASLARRF